MLHAQGAITDHDACSVVLSYLSGGFKKNNTYLRIGGKHIPRYVGDLIEAEPTPTGIKFTTKKGVFRLDYKDISTLRLFPKNDPDKIVFEDSADRPIMILDFRPPVDDRLVQALNKFVSEALAGHLYPCRAPLTPAEAEKELADFQVKAEAWRAMNPKPSLSDEVTKKRLLAEDAVQQQHLAAAGDYYSAGVTIDPMWAAGWYNAALISAELKDYSAAAFDMKHYLILLPDAPDAGVAKEKLLLWVAKSEETGKN
ncbi:MAG TPA: tetratricopeptide repeat protein [Candidatus Angelobacter sp.]